ncbi:metallophosphoesterase [Kangiella sp.]|uniref:metallophosphoesterase n=1 Tax=Kangiella sp. TaxID=1920245 RepID=UPI003A90687C
MVGRTPVVSGNGLYHQFGANHAGRDFVVGDLHGEAEKLNELLCMARFDWDSDRIFSAGDLVDRGPLSLRMALMTRQQGFIAVRGNHDQWCIDAGLEGDAPGHINNGGDWFYELNVLERSMVARLLNKLPVALSFIGPCGKKYGLVHAECPHHDWTHFEEILCGEWGNNVCAHFASKAIWSRKRYQQLDASLVRNVEAVFVGHTRVDQVKTLGNVCYLDTGACFEGGRLTMIELMPNGARHVYQV